MTRPAACEAAGRTPDGFSVGGAGQREAGNGLGLAAGRGDGEPLAVDALAVDVAGFRVGDEVVDRPAVDRHLAVAVGAFDVADDLRVDALREDLAGRLDQQRGPGGGARTVA